MPSDGEQVHLDAEEARAASTPHVVRWMLAISLLAAIILLTAIWVIGAWSSDQNTNTVAAQTTAAQEASQGTPVEPAFGSQPGTQPQTTKPDHNNEPLNMPNKNASGQ